jgi:hypothetical protein
MVLGPYPFVSEKQEELDETLSEYSSNLIESQYEYLLDSSGLEPIFEALLEGSPDLAKIPELDVFQPDSLMASSQQLDEFLPSALMDAMDNLKRLRSPGLIREITEAAAEKFCSDFEMVEAKLVAADELVDQEEDDEDDGNDEEIGKPRLRDLFPRTSGEIRVLLS